MINYLIRENINFRIKDELFGYNIRLYGVKNNIHIIFKHKIEHKMKMCSYRTYFLNFPLIVSLNDIEPYNLMLRFLNEVNNGSRIQNSLLVNLIRK